MIIDGSLDYAQARLQSRHGERAGDATWHRLEAIREFGALLDAASATSLQRWLVGITRHSSAHHIEALLRQHWRGSVAEVAGWMPASWQPALAWCAVLPDLPVLQHLVGGGAPLPWMRDEADWRALGEAPPAARAATLAQGRLRALVAAPPQALMPAWWAEWRHRLPEPLGGADDPLRQVVTTLQAHGAAFAAAPPGPGATLRQALQARLALLWRRAALTPAAAFIHLALCALDVERLRGELLTRRLFAPATAPEAA